MNKFVRQMLFVILLLSIVVSACAPATTPAPMSTDEPTMAADEPTTPAGDPTAEATAAGSGVDPYGAYDTPVKLVTVRRYETTEKLPEGDSPENNQYTRYIKDMLNIEPEYLWIASSADYDAKVNLAIASNDLPDAMAVNLAQFHQLVKNDQLADLTEVYNQYASPAVRQMMDSSNGIALDAVTFDGKIMGIPALTVPDDGYQLMWIRKDWLDKLGLEIPKTIDEVEAVAKAFVEQDPGGNGANKTIGIVGPQSGGLVHADFLQPTNGNFAFDPIFFSYKAYPGFWVEGADGKATYGSILPETKTALAKLADLYKKGLIDPEMGVRSDSAAPITAGQAGIYFGEWWNGYWPLPDAVKNNPEANWQAYAVPLDAEGMWNPHQGTPATSFVVVRKGYEHPEAAMKIVNLNNRDESKMDMSVGSNDDQVLRLPQAMYDEGQVTYQAMLDVLTGKAKAEDFADPKYDVYKLLKDDVAKIGTAKLEPFDNMDIKNWDTTSAVWSRSYSILVGNGAIYNPIGGKDKVNVVFSMTYAPTPLVTTKWANLQALEAAVFLKIIRGDEPIDAFDQFVTDWKAQGGDDLTAEIQASIK